MKYLVQVRKAVAEIIADVSESVSVGEIGKDEAGTVVTVKPLEKDAHKVIIQALVASSIVDADDQNPTLFYTYTKVSAK